MKFVRLHDGQIINLAHVSRVFLSKRGDMLIHFGGGKELRYILHETDFDKLYKAMGIKDE